MSLYIPICLILIAFLDHHCADVADTLRDQPIEMSNATFMYFAYGSNLLAKRIHIRNPSAVRKGSGKLSDYKLDFLTESKNWNGTSATIVKQIGSCVWGAIWEINLSHMKDLDSQEGVEVNLYKVLNRTINTPTGEEIECRLYQQVNDPDEIVDFENLPTERQPSKTYLNVILQGAEESKLPSDYIANLKKIPHNGKEASKMMKELGWK